MLFTEIALALADAFDCGVNDLPLSMILSWYEQKAVCILLTLLHLGIKDIRLGPTLPAFHDFSCSRCPASVLNEADGAVLVITLCPHWIRQPGSHVFLPGVQNVFCGVPCGLCRNS